MNFSRQKTILFLMSLALLFFAESSNCMHVKQNNMMNKNKQVLKKYERKKIFNLYLTRLNKKLDKKLNKKNANEFKKNNNKEKFLGFLRLKTPIEFVPEFAKTENKSLSIRRSFNPFMSVFLFYLMWMQILNGHSISCLNKRCDIEIAMCKNELNQTNIFSYYDNRKLFSDCMQDVVRSSKVEYNIEYKEIKTKDIGEVLANVYFGENMDNQTIVIFDIDGVVMIPKVLLGSDPWAFNEWGKYFEKYKIEYIEKYNNGNSKDLSVDIIEKATKEAKAKAWEEYKIIWSLVQNNVEVRMVDEKLMDILEKLYEKGIKIMGFTARGMNLVNRTKDQIDSLKKRDIDKDGAKKGGVKKTSMGVKEKYINKESEIKDWKLEKSDNFGLAKVDLASEEVINSVGQYFALDAYFQEKIEAIDYISQDGVLFTKMGGNKGEILKKFFAKIGKRPRKIVFVDDRKENIEAMGKMCKEEQIPFVSIWYDGAEDIVKLDDRKKKICDIQLEHLKKTGKVLSDEQAAFKD